MLSQRETSDFNIFNTESNDFVMPSQNPRSRSNKLGQSDKNLSSSNKTRFFHQSHFKMDFQDPSKTHQHFFGNNNRRTGMEMQAMYKSDPKQDMRFNQKLMQASYEKQMQSQEDIKIKMRELDYQFDNRANSVARAHLSKEQKAEKLKLKNMKIT